MIKLQLPRGPQYGQGRFLYCVFIEDPDGGGEDLMFTFRSNIFYSGGAVDFAMDEISFGELKAEAINLAKTALDWCADFEDYDFACYFELIGEIFE